MTGTSSVSNIDISILFVRGFIKTISKWGKKFFQIRAPSTTFISKWDKRFSKVRQRQVFQNGPMFQNGTNFYLKVEQLFHS